MTSVTGADEVLEVISEIARDAGRLISESAVLLPTLKWSEKSHADYVSEVDLRSEDLILTRLRANFPNAVLVAEEASSATPADRLGASAGMSAAPQSSGAPATTAAQLTFVVDPLDGTTNFLHGYPEYAVSIAAIEGGAEIAGVVLNVPTGELFSATRGGGAFRNGEQISVSRISEPRRALIGTGFPFRRVEEIPIYLAQLEQIFPATSGVRRAGSAALDLADVACGRLDGFWELLLSPWDVAAGILLVREAGGVVTDLNGVTATASFSSFVAGNIDIHRFLLEKTAAAARLASGSGDQ